MHIAVDARNIHAAGIEEEWQTLALLSELIQSRPEHHFTIIILQTGLLPALPNLTEHLITNTAKTYFQLRRWYSKMLPAICTQLGADLFIGINCATARIPIPQVLFMSSPNVAELPFTRTFLYLIYKKYRSRQIAKANAVATFTPLQQTIVGKEYKIKSGQVTAVGYTIPPGFMPVNWEQKESILGHYTNTYEYFLFTGSFTEDRFLLLLKAFSLFKKRQLSNMQLVAAGNFIPGKDFIEKLETYKYRADVQYYQHMDLQTMATLTAAAYAVIFLDEKAEFAFPVAAARQCGVPVIGLDSANATKEWAGPAGLYASQTPESLAEQMKLVYKDENLRKQLVVHAAGQALFVNNNAAAQKLWDCIDTAAGKIRLHLPPETKQEI